MFSSIFAVITGFTENRGWYHHGLFHIGRHVSFRNMIIHDPRGRWLVYVYASRKDDFFLKFCEEQVGLQASSYEIWIQLILEAII
jgi:hypothetical protein